MVALEKNPEEIAKAAGLAHLPKSEEYDKMISGMLWVFICEVWDTPYLARGIGLG